MFGYAKIGSHRTASSSIQSLYFRTLFQDILKNSS
jgi:hypothetical protein